MIIYAFVMNVSVAGLFLSGFVPGLMIGGGLMLMTVYLARKRNYPVATEKATWSECGIAFKDAFWALLTPVILLGGILGGVFTPTEAAAVAAFYAFIVSLFVLRTLTFKELPSIFISTAVQSGVILFLVGAARHLRLDHHHLRPGARGSSFRPEPDGQRQSSPVPG